METKDHENTNTNPIRVNVLKEVERLDMNFGGKIYDTQFTTSTGEKKKYFMRDMHKIDRGVTFTQVVAKKGIKNHGEREVAAMYK